MASTKFSASPKATDESLYDYNVDFPPNELDMLDSATYHFRFFIASSENFQKKSFGSNVPGEQITIAETGGTTIAINDIEILSIPGTSADAFTGASTTVNFSLKQPLGANLLDMIYYSTVELGIDNYLKCPYYLELSFRGRDPKTGLPYTPSKKWVWELAILKIDIDVDSSGSTYTVKAVVSDNLCNMQQNANIKTTSSITAGTVGEFFSQFQIALNKQIRDSNKRDNYVFNIDPIIAAEKLRNKNSDESPEHQGSFSYDNNGKTILSFNDGTDVLRVIDAVLSVTSLFQKEIKLSDDPDKNDATKKETIWKQLYRIHPDVKYEKYNPNTGDYDKTFTYNVVPYNLTTVVSTAKEVSETKNSNERVKTYLGTHVLKKHYNYIFTGLNQSILKFDMQFNCAWYSAVPIQQGSYASSSVALNSSRKKPNNYVERLTTNVDSDDDKACKMIANPTNVDANVNLTGVQLATTTSGQNAIPSTASSKPRIETSTRVEESSQKRAKDILDQTGNKMIQLPLTVIPTNQTADNNFAVEDVQGGGRSFLSGLFTSAMHSYNSDLLTIDLEVKGDPFWITPPAIPYNATSNIPVKGLIDMEKNRANLTSMGDKTSENYILFSSQTPVMDVITGDQVGSGFNQNSVINGIYAVIKVTHTFSNGLYTQKLNCVREQLTNVDDAVRKALEATNSTAKKQPTTDSNTNPTNQVNNLQA